MNLQNLESKHYRMTLRINILLLCTHICLFLLFLLLKIHLMVYVNICSILLYILLFFYYKKSIVHYVTIVFVEVLIHMSLATICMGWDAGFQFYSFCLIPCIFLCDYLNRVDGRKGMHPVPVSMIIMCLFLACRWYCTAYQAIYQQNNKLEYDIMFAYNMVVSFSFLILYIFIFEKRILQREKMLENMAEIDELTQLPNRYLMQTWLAEGFYRMKNGTSMAIAMVDIDDFKKLNDVYGHNCGDYVLRIIAEKIQQVQKETIHASRWGGEEFLFLTTGDNVYEKLYQQLEQLRTDIEQQPIVFQEHRINVTITAGVIHEHPDDRTFFDAIARADKCMYEGKKCGKNRVIRA